MIGEGWLSNYYLSLAYIGIVVVDIFEFNDNLKNSIIYILADYFLILCFQLFGAMVYTFLFHTETVSVTGATFVNAAMLLSLFIIFYKYNLSIFFEKFLEKGKITNYLLIILGIALAILFKKQITALTLKWDLVVFALIFFSILILVTIKLVRERMQKAHYIEQLHQYEQYNIVYKDMISEIRHRQHDFNNHLQALYSMNMACENIEELRKEQYNYFKKLENDNKTYHLLKENVSSILVAFLYIKFKEVQNQGIQVDYTISVNQLENVIPFSDFVELVGNLLDNAVEATVKNSVKAVKFLLEESSTAIHLEISNSYEWTENERLNFAIKDGKSDKGSGHGYGLTNVKKIVDKYKGLLQIKFDYDVDYKIIVFDILFPLKKEDSLI